MLSLCVTRARLGRPIITPVLRTHAKKFYSAKSSSINSTKYFAAVGLVSTSGLWWLLTAGDDVPTVEASSTERLVVEPHLSKDQVTRIISQEAYSFLIRNIAGVNRYDGAQLASNSPCEDRFTHGQLPSPWNDGDKWMAWAVFDGHSGWQTAELLKKQLLPFVRHSLSQVERPSHEKSVPEDLVRRAIINGFVNLDNSIMETALDATQSQGPLQEKVQKLVPAFAGSCALLSIYDPTTSTLHVGCTGDSRAVLGQQQPDGKWEAIPLSVDQTGSNKEEVARILEEHPGEEDIAKDGRILGIMVSRAFGDSRWKWPLELQQDIRRRFYGPAPLTPKYDIRTPPYLTAEPVVTTTKIDPRKPSFLIMATDGLWDMLDSQQAVDLVGKWLSGVAEERNGEQKPVYEPFDFAHFREGVNWRFVEGRTTIQDDNVAVHLMRNCLGGNHHELITARLAFDPPFSRDLRDDITVQVIFFGVPGLGNK